ncbi:MAG: hypothetical protein NTY19_01780 [Planctomycetota bacterium]|nr:hypothetical protein [Planctomycetota bacterium]
MNMEVSPLQRERLAAGGVVAEHGHLSTFLTQDDNAGPRVACGQSHVAQRASVCRTDARTHVHNDYVWATASCRQNDGETSRLLRIEGAQVDVT